MMGLRASRPAPLAIALTLSAAGCTAGTVAPAGQPVADPRALEAALRRESLPASPRQANFTWTLDEAGSRLRGSGVVRFIAPERLRLDLFGPRGETYLAAALVGEEFRVPPAAAQTVALPSPALLWAALGVVRPPVGAELTGATATDSTATLRYRTGAGEAFEFRAAARGDSLRLVAVERTGPSGVLETVRIERSPSGALQRTRYVDRSTYRELILEMETIKDVPSFPESIWSPGSPGA